MPKAETELLAEVPMFATLSEKQRAALASMVDVERISAGQTLLKTGDPGGSMYVIRSGEAEAFIFNDTGEKMTLETLHPGDFFGEIAMLADTPRTASVQVTKDLEALRLDRDDLEQFLEANPTAAIGLLNVMARRLHTTSDLLRHTASRNPNEVIQDNRTPLTKAADWIAEFSGSINFVLIHAVLFTVWILANQIPGIPHFDPFPYGLLTMCVSLEAIFLSTFVLLSQNRQVEKDRIRGDIEYDVNLKAEKQIAHLHVKIDELRSELLRLLRDHDSSDGSGSSHFR